MSDMKTMQLGMIGLGRMGANMVRWLMKSGHECVVFDRSPEAVQDLKWMPTSVCLGMPRLGTPHCLRVRTTAGRIVDSVLRAGTPVHEGKPKTWGPTEVRLPLRKVGPTRS
jgi:6-phosphogluconate dehydrogenase (decarboxylating)